MSKERERLCVTWEENTLDAIGVDTKILLSLNIVITASFTSDISLLIVVEVKA